MRVLIACEESQEVCKAFREKGYEAYSCDLQESSGGHSEWHLQTDAIVEAYSGKYDLMIAHPPCTYISKAGARWMYPSAGIVDQERLKKAKEAKEFFITLLRAPIYHIALENPTPLRILEMPPYTQAIQPFEYGHEYSKRTLLWLKNLPNLKPTDIRDNHTPFLPSNTGGKKKGQKFSRGIARNAKESSKTFSGVAKAMAEQWGAYINGSNKEHKLF